MWGATCFSTTVLAQVRNREFMGPDVFAVVRVPIHPEDWTGFRLQGGCYEPLVADAEDTLPSQRLGLRLVRWDGRYQEVEAVWLRWIAPAGRLLPTKDDLREQERQRVEQALQRAEQERERAERLAERLRALGVDPDAV